MKKMRLVLALAMLALVGGRSFALDLTTATLAFDETNQKMHLLLEANENFSAVIQFVHLPAECGLPLRYEDGELVSGVVAENVDGHWCELDLYVGNLPIGEAVNVQANVSLYSADWSQSFGTQNIVDWNGLQTLNGQTLEYLNDNCTPVVPQTIPVNSAFCATICHGSYLIPIECEDPGYTPGSLEVTVTNRCDPALGSHCNNPDCPGVDWSLFNWQIRVFPNCLLFLTMTYCGEAPGCVCIWRSDFILPVEINGFSALAGDNQVSLNWSVASESDLKEYRISKSLTREGGYFGIGSVDAQNSAAGARYSFVDEDVQNGTTYYYKLHVEDMNGNISVYNIDGQSVVAEATPQGGLVASEFSLSQNYPNPFNAQTAFSFNLPAATDVSLKVYDMLGREVATVVEGAMNAGTHTVNWSAEGLATGVYLYTLKAGEVSQSNKLLYLK